MINCAKNVVLKAGYTYKDIGLILGITERQAQNILSGINKSLYNYLAISKMVNKKIEELWNLDNDEIKNIEKRLELISSLK